MMIWESGPYTSVPDPWVSSGKRGLGVTKLLVTLKRALFFPVKGLNRRREMIDQLK